MLYQHHIQDKKDELKAKQIIVQAIRKKQEDIELEYHTQKLLNEIHPDREQSSQLLEQTRRPPKNVRDRLLYEHINHNQTLSTPQTFKELSITYPISNTHINNYPRTNQKERPPNRAGKEPQPNT